MLTCTFHPHIATDRWCTKCARSACEACLRKVEFGQHCVGCVEGRRAPGEPRLSVPDLRGAVSPARLRGAVSPAKIRGAWSARTGSSSAADEAQTRPGWMFYAVFGLFVVACAVAAAVPDAGIPAALAGAEPAVGARAAALLVVLSGALVGLILHEWAHAAVAYRGGDDSVVEKGYLTMDVRHYSHPVLSIAFPLVCVALGGLPLPGGAVWIETEWLRGKWWDSAVSAAGPAVSLLFGLVLFALSGLAGDHEVLAASLAFLGLIEVGLVILNLVPVPGLDGYGILEPHLPEDLRSSLAPVKQYGIFIVAALVFGSPALDFIWDWASWVSEHVGVAPQRTWLGQLLAQP